MGNWSICNCVGDEIKDATECNPTRRMFQFKTGTPQAPALVRALAHRLCTFINTTFATKSSSIYIKTKSWVVAWFFGDQLLVRNFGLYGTICRGNAVNPLKPNGNYMYQSL
jgi:hypothetical protein